MAQRWINLQLWEPGLYKAWKGCSLAKQSFWRRKCEIRGKLHLRHEVNLVYYDKMLHAFHACCSQTVLSREVSHSTGMSRLPLILIILVTIRKGNWHFLQIYSQRIYIKAPRKPTPVSCDPSFLLIHVHHTVSSRWIMVADTWKVRIKMDARPSQDKWCPSWRIWLAHYAVRNLRKASGTGAHNLSDGLNGDEELRS